jgi:uncharacterized coiled-coil DUF342 family protein
MDESNNLKQQLAAQ